MKKSLNNIILILVCILLLAACQNETTEDRIIIGYDNTFVPMGFLDEFQNVTGFDVELASEVFRRLDIDYKFQSIDWSMKETELNAGNIDLIWNGYSLTEERQKKVAYTEPYLNNRQIIITLESANVFSIADLVNQRIGTQQGSASLEAIEKDTTLSIAPTLYETFDQAFRDLDAKRIDAVVVDEVLGRYYLSQKESQQYRILDEDLGEEVFVVGARKTDTELIASINTILTDMKLDGTFDAIYEKWFSTSSDNL